ncbi:hypothetical protein [Natronobacterium gregoryi]|uniref:Uncharacterized protein n=2 Tax=Natronobacterium gregoryi TaxID=44930 RepID=L0AGN9_NATGS|nr:hypothetical protein [Natronobacterium gregoryi]AFZ72240.1 hypothetical protein Natgr_1009 [Natronobacterium gregoryi SP2]ELY62360.1 hypothetical protein C490_18423 [Natronobacterium gregoryi SP2]PLK20187.1 hypothetical protein CYV19_10870 [Natronobacterium gregoryi SP2]SFJ28745.1 hypothetical protein SAMN05443661_12038 [Natronobacterium gregoryi]
MSDTTGSADESDQSSFFEVPYGDELLLLFGLLGLGLHSIGYDFGTAIVILALGFLYMEGKDDE